MCLRLGNRRKKQVNNFLFSFYLVIMEQGQDNDDLITGRA